VLALGTPVVEIEIAGQVLEATVYMPPDRGKNIRPGMEVRVEPTTIKREEYGAIVGKVVTVSDFPVTPQGMLADLHNDALVQTLFAGRHALCGESDPGARSFDRQRVSLDLGQGASAPDVERHSDPGRG